MNLNWLNEMPVARLPKAGCCRDEGEHDEDGSRADDGDDRSRTYVDADEDDDGDDGEDDGDDEGEEEAAADGGGLRRYHVASPLVVVKGLQRDVGGRDSFVNRRDS